MILNIWKNDTNHKLKQRLFICNRPSISECAKKVSAYLKGLSIKHFRIIECYGKDLTSKNEKVIINSKMPVLADVFMLSIG